MEIHGNLYYMYIHINIGYFIWKMMHVPGNICYVYIHVNI